MTGAQGLLYVHQVTDSPLFSSLTISSCSKELYAGFSNSRIVAWVKPKQDFCEDTEFEHIKLENYMHGRL